MSTTFFDWARVRWDGPDDPLSYVCSYCGVEIDEDAIPVRVWGELSGRAAVFCDACTDLVIREAFHGRA